MKVRLETADGQLVSFGFTLPVSLGHEPEAVCWGTRFFVRARPRQKIKDADTVVVYREAFVLAVMNQEPLHSEPTWEEIRAALITPPGGAPREPRVTQPLAAECGCPQPDVDDGNHREGCDATEVRGDDE